MEASLGIGMFLIIAAGLVMNAQGVAWRWLLGIPLLALGIFLLLSAVMSPGNQHRPRR